MIDFRALKFCEEVDQMHLDHGVFAAHSVDQVRNHVLISNIFNDFE